MKKKVNTILFIEDDADQQRMYSLAFKKTGYRFLVASGGEEGIALAAKEKPDLILLDILMPGMDGIETLKLIRQNTRIPADTPVVILTNYTKEEAWDKAKILGAEEIIVKTQVVPHELVRLIKEKYFTKEEK